MNLSKDQRGTVTVRTLEHLSETLQKVQAAGGDLKKAKDFYNVIHAPLFNIPIDQSRLTDFNRMQSFTYWANLWANIQSQK